MAEDQAARPADNSNNERVYSPKEPFKKFIARKNKDGESPFYWPMLVDDPFEAEFQVPRGLPFTAATMSDLYLSDNLLDEIAKRSTAYAKKVISRNKVVTVKKKDVLNFFAVYQYMGIVKLPSKEDYLRTSS